MGTFVYGDERFAGFSSRKPREERYYGYDALGSNRTVTDERGAAVGTQSFDTWGVPDPTKHAGTLGRPLSQHDYAYAAGTRTSRVDPSTMAGIQ